MVVLYKMGRANYLPDISLLNESECSRFGTKKVIYFEYNSEKTISKASDR